MAIVVRKSALLGEQRTREARAEAEEKAVAADDVVSNGSSNRRIDRMPQVDHRDGRAHADLLGERRRLAHEQFRNGQRVDAIDVHRLAVMLADVCITHAELIGKDDLLQILLVGLSG